MNGNNLLRAIIDYFMDIKVIYLAILIMYILGLAYLAIYLSLYR